MNRRSFLTATVTNAALGAAVLVSDVTVLAQTNLPYISGPGEVARKRGPQELALVYAFVGAGHGNVGKVKELMAQDPHLIYASRDWGGGDWETALGGAAHTGHREIAEYLLLKARALTAFRQPCWVSVRY